MLPYVDIGGPEFVLVIAGGGGGGLLDASTIAQWNVNYTMVLATKLMGSVIYLQTFQSNKFDINNSNCLIALIFKSCITHVNL